MSEHHGQELPSISLGAYARVGNSTIVAVNGVNGLESLTLHGVRLRPEHIVDFYLAMMLPYAIGRGQKIIVPTSLSAKAREYWEKVSKCYAISIERVLGCSGLGSPLVDGELPCRITRVEGNSDLPYEEVLFLSLGKESLISDAVTRRSAHPIYLDLDYRSTFATISPLDVFEKYTVGRQISVVCANVPYPSDSQWTLGGVPVRREQMLGFMRGIGMICAFIGRAIAARILIGCEAEVWNPAKGVYWRRSGCDYTQTREFAEMTSEHTGCRVRSPVGDMRIESIFHEVYRLNLCCWLRSCSLARGKQRWCYDCEKCLSVFLLAQARDLDLARIEFDEVMLKSSRTFSEFESQRSAGRHTTDFYV